LLNASHNVCYAHTPTDLGWVFAAYDHALGVVQEMIDSGSVESHLGNQVIRPVFSVRSAS
jgi:hypothetical protein